MVSTTEIYLHRDATELAGSRPTKWSEAHWIGRDRGEW
jgi:hypothetical protein